MNLVQPGLYKMVQVQHNDDWVSAADVHNFSLHIGDRFGVLCGQRRCYCSDGIATCDLFFAIRSDVLKDVLSATQVNSQFIHCFVPPLNTHSIFRKMVPAVTDSHILKIVSHTECFHYYDYPFFETLHVEIALRSSIRRLARFSRRVATTESRLIVLFLLKKNHIHEESIAMNILKRLKFW